MLFSITDKLAWLFTFLGRLSSDLTTILTAWPRFSSSSTSRRPVAPLAPTMRIVIFVPVFWVLAKWLDCLPGHINASELTIENPFQIRRRGVELKLHLGDPPPEIDETLVQNIVKGRRWLAMVIDGKSFSEIAQVENVSTRRVQDIANLALIAPDILDAITLGEKPDGLSTDYLIKTRFSAIWSEQRAQFSAL